MIRNRTKKGDAIGNRPNKEEQCDRKQDYFSRRSSDKTSCVTAMPHVRDQTAAYEKAIRNENVFKLEWPGSHRPELP
jgi:hypothetical protein